MEKKVRALLLNLFGFERYLSLVSNIYIRMIRLGFMKNKYPELFFLKKLIEPGFVCIDVGANVGYYSSFLSLYAGKTGHVYAVEPVALFAKIFKKNTKRFGIDNITLYQTALGGSTGKVIMGTPVIDGVLRHGLTSVVSEEQAKGMHTYEVPLQVPDELFANLTRLDYIKCDVEGYEVYLFPHFMKTIEKFKPIIQIEISTEENRRQIFGLLETVGYTPYRINMGELQPMQIVEALSYDRGDFYFLPY